MTTTTPTPVDVAWPNKAAVLQILKMHLTGDDPTVIAVAADVPHGMVSLVAEHHGWPDKQKVRAALRRLELSPAPTPNAMPSARPLLRRRPPRPTEPELIAVSQPEDPATMPVERLFEAVRGTGVDRLRTKAARAEREIASVRDAYAGYVRDREQAEEQRKQREAQRREVERLEKELAKARAAAGIASQAGDRLVRAWAKKQGLEVAVRGRLPQRIRDAYADAHAKTGTGR